MRTQEGAQTLPGTEGGLQSVQALPASFLPLFLEQSVKSHMPVPGMHIHEQPGAGFSVAEGGVGVQGAMQGKHWADAAGHFTPHLGQELRKDPDRKPESRPSTGDHTYCAYWHSGPSGQKPTK